MRAPWIAALVLSLSTAFVATSAFARATLSVTEKVELAVPPAKAWEVVKDYGGIHKWHPGFSGDEIIKGRNNAKGAVRVLTLKDGGKITEELLAYSAKGMQMKYRIIESPLPITGYVSTIKVTPAEGGGSIVTWSSTFKGKGAKPQEGADDASLRKAVSGVYTVGFENLKNLLAK